MGYIPRNKDLALCHTKVLVQVGEVHFIVKFWMAYGVVVSTQGYMYLKS